MISAVIPSYGRFELLLPCIESVNNSQLGPDETIEVIVVTSIFSPDHLLAIEQTGAKIVMLPERALMSASRNEGARRAAGDLLLFLDDDNVVDSHAISVLAGALNSLAHVALVGPLMYYGSQPERLWCAGVTRSRILLRTNFRTTLPEPIPALIESDDFPNCFMVRKLEFELVGGFDARRFPQHMSEADLARRLTNATGKQVRCVTASRIWHFIEPAFVRRIHVAPRNEVDPVGNRDRAYWIGNGRVLYTALYASTAQWLLFTVLGLWALAAVYVWALATAARGNVAAQAQSYARGLIDGLRLGYAARSDTLQRH